jgi:hypothetical protein
MELIKRNSTEFNDVEKLIRQYVGKPAAKKLIYLYALKPGEPLEKKILINKLKENGDVLYGINYNTILDYFEDKSEKLFREGNRKPFYYFKTSLKSDWIKYPFEFTGRLKKQLFPLKVVHR